MKETKLPVHLQRNTHYNITIIQFAKSTKINGYKNNEIIRGECYCYPWDLGIYWRLVRPVNRIGIVSEHWLDATAAATIANDMYSSSNIG
jgi:hypothetical protein